MIDTYTKVNNNQTFEFHSVSGIMCKSHPKSIICKTGKDPYLLDMEFPRTKQGQKVYLEEKWKYTTEVVVLQVMILEDGFLVEYLPKELYEEIDNE